MWAMFVKLQYYQRVCGLLFHQVRTLEDGAQWIISIYFDQWDKWPGSKVTDCEASVEDKTARVVKHKYHSAGEGHQSELGFSSGQVCLWETKQGNKQISDFFFFLLSPLLFDCLFLYLWRAKIFNRTNLTSTKGPSHQTFRGLEGNIARYT